MRHFPILSFFLSSSSSSSSYYYYYFIIIIIFCGGGSKLSIMIATLKKNRMEQPPPPPHPLENKNDLPKSHNMPFFGGRWGELMKSYCCLFCQKIALHKLKTGKDVLRGVPLLDFYRLRLLLSGQTM